MHSSNDADLESGTPEFNSDELSNPGHPGHCFHTNMDVANESPPADAHHHYFTDSIKADNSLSSAATQLSHSTPTAMATNPPADESGHMLVHQTKHVTALLQRNGLTQCSGTSCITVDAPAVGTYSVRAHGATHGDTATSSGGVPSKVQSQGDSPTSAPLGLHSVVFTKTRW